MVERRGRLRLPVNGEETAVPSAVHLRCPKCGEMVLRAKDARRLSEDAIAIYRRQHGLLAAEQIRGIRVRFGLTQAAFARLLRLGSNTLSRWESGRKRADRGDGHAPAADSRRAGQHRVPARARNVANRCERQTLNWPRGELVTLTAVEECRHGRRSNS